MTAVTLTAASGSSNGAAADYSSRAQMQKAKLLIRELKSEPGGGTAGADLGSIDFQFNPKEVTIAKSAKWERKPAKGAKRSGPPEFSGTDPSKITLEVFFDATDKPSEGVATKVDKLFECLVITGSSSGQQKASPPLVILSWGTITSFPAFVTSVSAKYTLFGPDGTPLRAACSVSLEEMPPPDKKQNPTSGGRVVHHARRVTAGDTLALLAHAEYDDPGQWRKVAAYNEIDDPMRIPAGAVVLLPPPSELG